MAQHIDLVIILAAGLGSRLLPITEIMPKCLVKVAGRPLIDYQIKAYINSGISEENINIVVGYMSDEIEKYLKIYYPKIKIIKSINYKNTNNMYSLYLALSEIYKKTKFQFKNLFINNADCIYDDKIINDLVNSDIENAIASEIGTYIEESMKIIISPDGNITNIAKTIEPNQAEGVSVDLYKYSNKAVIELFDIIKEFIEIKKDLKQWTEVSFPELFKRVKVIPFNIKNQKWIEIDNIDDLLVADKLFSSFNYKSKKAFICDLDGTIFLGDTPIKEAISFINDNKKNFDFYFLTNNTSKTPLDYVKKLAKYGLNIEEKQITTPLFALIDYINNKKYHSVYLVSNDDVKIFMQQKLPNVSFDFDIKNNQAVILTYDTSITYEKLKNFCILLNNANVEYIATHSDNFCPNEFGPIPDIGSFISLIKTTSNFEPSTILGKPSINLIKKHLEKYGAKNIVIVGDRLNTDKKLADDANCDFICVLSGETTRLNVALDTTKHPAIVLKNLGNLA